MKNKILNFALLLVMVSSLGITQPAAAVGPETWYVSSTAGNDSNTCNTVGTPCLTINAAINQAADGDTVKVAVGIYTASSGTEVVLINKSITLSGGWDEAFTTQDGTSTIDGGGARRVVYIYQGNVEIHHFSIQNGYYYTGAGIGAEAGYLKIFNSKILNNFAEYKAAGIESSNDLEIVNSTIDGNVVGVSGYAGGAAIGLTSTSQISLSNTTISNNKILFEPEPSWLPAAVETFTTASMNIYINNSTISNTVGGYGISSGYGSVNINNSTITLNNKGGIIIISSTVNLSNTILAGNGTNPDCSVFAANSGVFNSLGYNLIGNKTDCSIKSGTGDKFGNAVNPIVPNLAPLADNGGPTYTHALYSNSPALNAGNNSTCLTTDQRGLPRPEGTRCDMGAFEGSIPAIYPILKSPGGMVTVQSPKFSWTKVKGATKYQLQVVKGSKVVYSVSVGAASCGNTLCNKAIDKTLGFGSYKWRVHALIGGVWQDYSPDKNFIVTPAKPGRWTWSDDSPRFYILNSKPVVVDFSILVRDSICGTHRITHINDAVIAGNAFKLTGGFSVSGKFTTLTSATGTLALKNYYIPGCGYGSGGPYTWEAKWGSSSQPKIKLDLDSLDFKSIPRFETPFEISILN